MFGLAQQMCEVQLYGCSCVDYYFFTIFGLKFHLLSSKNQR